MTAYERMMKRTNSTGSTIREQIIANTREEFEALLQDDPSYQSAEIIRGDGVIGSINLRMDNRKIKNEAPQMDVYSSLNNTIKPTYGDVLHTADTEGGEVKESYWLCIDEHNFCGIYRKNIVEECNYYLPFQNKDTLKLHGRWCSVRSPYSSGINEGKTISTGNAKYDITLPYDEETKLFHKDYRFIIDYANNKPIPYKIILFNGVTNRYTSRQEGFLTIKVEEDRIQNDDNWELGIANYIEQKDNSVLSIGVCEIMFSGKPIVNASGSVKKFSAIFFDDDGNSITAIDPIWSIEPLNLITSNAIEIVSQFGNEIEIRANSNANIGDTFLLKLNGEDDVFGLFETTVDVFIAKLL